MVSWAKLPVLLGNRESESQLKGKSAGGVLRFTQEVKQLKVMCITAPEGGHLVPTAQLANAIARRGHRSMLVTCACAIEKVSKSCDNAGCTAIGVAADVKSAESGEGEAAQLMNMGHMIRMFKFYNDSMYDEVKALVQIHAPDAIVADFVTPCAWEIGEEFGIPVIINVPGPLAMMGNITWPVVISFCLGTWKSQGQKEAAAAWWAFSRMYNVTQSKPCLFNTFFGLEPPQSVRSNHLITGTTAPRSCGKLATTSHVAFNEWLTWVRIHGLKVVYVTMGSMQQLTVMQVRALYGGLVTLSGCAIAWSLKPDQQKFLPVGCLADLPQHIFIDKWLPQGEALQLPDVAVVITHCGWGGLNETIAAGKPIVATPFRADQPTNAGIAQKRGLAEVLDVETLTPQAVNAAVRKVLENPSYARCAEELRRSLAKTGGAEACVEYVERLVEHGFAETVSAPPRMVESIVPLTKPLFYGLLGGVVATLVPIVTRNSRDATQLLQTMVRVSLERLLSRTVVLGGTSN